ncbi:FMN-binding glutamate synthase family protein [Oceanobacillus jeddahense]|uniref:FMN-binding glutamate synthase family protein n=1 Tax=Oceanobacillus jeddahense TaxID=1462527 RepID=UPI0005962883|nr:FMN-binding glutamate synthase family protein [Oceanobacillus jeddahense]
MEFSALNFILFALSILVVAIIITPIALFSYIYWKDQRQPQHAILRNYPLLGKIRYILEKAGPELRQYLFNADTAGKPFSRDDYRDIIMPAKYQKNMIGFGSRRDFEKADFYVKNAMFPKQQGELEVDNTGQIDSKIYKVKEDNLLSRKENVEDKQIQPWLLSDENAVVIGPSCREPFYAKGLIGMSAMSYGALGENAITALSKGIGMAGGSWMNTGEGGLSDYHLAGDTDIIAQIGPGLFGVRTASGSFNWDLLKEKSEIPQVKAFELKLAQGAKIRGGHVDAEKVTERIAAIRHVAPYQEIDSPNRFHEFDDVPSMFTFIEKIRNHTGLPVGIKLVIGSTSALDEIASYMKETQSGPDFITVDGSEGGTGATFQELADSVGLPIKSAVTIADQTLKKYGVRDRVKLIASGKLFTADRIAVILGMGADLVQIARAFMITVGCIMAQICHTNRCPVGVATTDPKLQKALVVDEKAYRALNYLVTLRESLFRISAAAGVTTPTAINASHIQYKDAYQRVWSLDEWIEKEGVSSVTSYSKPDSI